MKEVKLSLGWRWVALAAARAAFVSIPAMILAGLGIRWLTGYVAATYGITIGPLFFTLLLGGVVYGTMWLTAGDILRKPAEHAARRKAAGERGQSL